MSPKFQSLEVESLGTRVRSYFTGANADAAKTALYAAVGALQVYSDELGPTPTAIWRLCRRRSRSKGWSSPPSS